MANFSKKFSHHYDPDDSSLDQICLNLSSFFIASLILSAKKKKNLENFCFSEETMRLAPDFQVMENNFSCIHIFYAVLR